MLNTLYRMMQVVFVALAIGMPADAVQCKAGLEPHTYSSGEIRCVRQCQGKTKAGARCKRTVGVNKQGYCAQHNTYVVHVFKTRK